MDLEQLVTQQSNQIANLMKMLSQIAPQKETPSIHKKSKGGRTVPYVSEGTIFLRRDGRWEAKLVIGGKQRSVACCKRQAKALKSLREAIKEKRNVLFTRKDVSKTYTLFSWLEHWYNVFRLPKKGTDLSENTLLSDMYTIKKIKKIFEDIELTKLSSAYVQEKLNSMEEGRSCEAVYNVLKLSLEKAKEFLGKNIMEYVEKVKYEKQTGRVLSSEEMEKILKQTKNDFERNVWMIYFNTGCRANEILRIKAKHVDLENNTIFIDGTKNKTSKRNMPIFSQLRPILKEMIQDKNPEDYLVPKTKEQMKCLARRAKKNTGIEFTTKDARHTLATRCKDAGIPVAVYSPWFGWADDTMAKRIYTHATQRDDEVAQEWAKKISA